MNRAVVTRAAAGLAAYLARAAPAATPAASSSATTPGTARDAFAEDTAAVSPPGLATPLLLPGPLPTPVLAYAVRSSARPPA